MFTCAKLPLHTPSWQLSARWAFCSESRRTCPAPCPPRAARACPAAATATSACCRRRGWDSGAGCGSPPGWGPPPGARGWGRRCGSIPSSASWGWWWGRGTRGSRGTWPTPGRGAPAGCWLRTCPPCSRTHPQSRSRCPRQNSRTEVHGQSPRLEFVNGSTEWKCNVHCFDTAANSTSAQ